MEHQRLQLLAKKAGGEKVPEREKKEVHQET